MLQAVQVETQAEQQGLTHLHPKRATGRACREFTLDRREQCFNQGTAAVELARKRPPHFGAHFADAPRLLPALGGDYASCAKVSADNTCDSSRCRIRRRPALTRESSSNLVVWRD